MTDPEIISELRARSGMQSAVELARFLGEATEGGLPSSGTFISFFKRAFPEIPLHVLYDACLVAPSGPVGGSNDAKLNDLLRTWLPNGSKPAEPEE